MRRSVIIVALILALIGGTPADAQSRRGGGFVRALIAAGVAAAIGKGGVAKPSEKDYGERILRPAQLKDCLITAHRLDLQDEELGYQSRQIDLENSAITGAKDQLERNIQFPATSQLELDEINHRIDAFNGRVRTQQYIVEIYNQRVQAQSNAIASWNQSCADHKFFWYDLNVIKAELPFNIEQYIQREGVSGSRSEVTSAAAPTTVTAGVAVTKGGPSGTASPTLVRTNP